MVFEPNTYLQVVCWRLIILMEKLALVVAEESMFGYRAKSIKVALFGKFGLSGL